MTKLHPYQSCRSNDGWVPVNVASSTRPLDWIVMVCPWNHYSENICECPGYLYRGTCKHQLIASQSLCRWTELTHEEQQTEEQRANKVCPKCGGLTSWQLEVKEE